MPFPKSTPAGEPGGQPAGLPAQAGAAPQATQPTPQASQSQQTQWTPPPGEEWRKDLPEDLRQKPLPEIVKWSRNASDQLGSLNADLGNYKKTIRESQQQLQSLQGQYQQAMAALQEWQGFWRDMEPQWQQYQQWLSSQQGGAAAEPVQSMTAGATTPTGDLSQFYASLADLPEPERFQRFHNLLGQQFQTSMQQFGQQVAQAVQQQVQQAMRASQEYIADREKYFRNYLTLWQKAMDAKSRNPNLDVDKAVQEAIALTSMQRDPFEVGITLTTQEQRIQEEIAKARKLWEQELKQQQATQQQAPMTSATPPSYRLPETSRQVGAAGLRQNAARRLAEKFGAGIFQP